MQNEHFILQLKNIRCSDGHGFESRKRGGNGNKFIDPLILK